MTLVASLLVAVLAVVNLRVGRSLLYPPALYSVWWAVLLFIVWLSGDTFYPLSLKTLSVYVLGTMAFTLGASLRLLSWRIQPEQYVVSDSQHRAVNRFLLLGTIVLLAAFPLYWQRLHELQAASSYSDFWRGVRQQTSSGLVGESGFGLYEYFMSIASFMSMIAVYHADGSRRSRLRAVAVIAITLTYHFLTSARQGAMTTLFGIVAISWMRAEKVKWKTWCASGLLLLVVFAVPAVLLHKGGDLSKSLGDNAIGVLQSLQQYSVGGLVGFNQVIDDLSVFPEWLSFRFFFALARAIGFGVEVPLVILPFTATPAPTNIYTIYGSYFADFGWSGTVVIMCLHGYWMTMLFQSAVRRRPEAVVLFGIAVSRMLMSSATDGFLISLSFWLQAIACTLAVYHWPLLSRTKNPSKGLLGADLKAALEYRGGLD
jgi:oligosaccharide repeat unit polymerase